MKFVVVPEPVAVADKRTGKPILRALPGSDPAELADSHKRAACLVPMVVTMRDFIYDYVLTSSEIGKGGEGARRVRKLEVAFADSKPGTIVGVEDDDYKIVCRILDNLEWLPQFAPHSAQLLPFFEAWDDAKKQDEAWARKHEEGLKAV